MKKSEKQQGWQFVEVLLKMAKDGFAFAQQWKHTIKGVEVPTGWVVLSAVACLVLVALLAVTTSMFSPSTSGQSLIFSLVIGAVIIRLIDMRFKHLVMGVMGMTLIAALFVAFFAWQKPVLFDQGIAKAETAIAAKFSGVDYDRMAQTQDFLSDSGAFHIPNQLIPTLLSRYGLSGSLENQIQALTDRLVIVPFQGSDKGKLLIVAYSIRGERWEGDESFLVKAADSLQEYYAEAYQAIQPTAMDYLLNQAPIKLRHSVIAGGDLFLDLELIMSLNAIESLVAYGESGITFLETAGQFSSKLLYSKQVGEFTAGGFSEN